MLAKPPETCVTRQHVMVTGLCRNKCDILSGNEMDEDEFNLSSSLNFGHHLFEDKGNSQPCRSLLCSVAIAKLT
jgi:hypothetical protein